MDLVWRDLQVKFQQGLAWLSYFLWNNPLYAALALLCIIILLWMLLKPDLSNK